MSQTQPIGKVPLNLLDINFNTKINILYPNTYKSKKFDNYYKIPVGDDSFMVKRDTTYINQFTSEQKSVGLEYNQISSSSAAILAVVGKHAFEAVSIAVSLNGNIKAIGAEKSEITKDDAKKLIETITKKYGNFKKIEGEFMDKFTIYEWETKDRMFRYATIFNDEKNTVKLEVDRDQKTIANIDRSPHYDGYFFVINKTYIDDVKTLGTGIFVYIK